MALKVKIESQACVKNGNYKMCFYNLSLIIRHYFVIVHGVPKSESARDLTVFESCFMAAANTYCKDLKLWRG